jgi:NitT/TauT family transport system ATP-binding protein
MILERAPAAGNADCVVVDTLSKRFDHHGNFAFKDISFSIRKGEFVALIGPSGCGKSTLLQIVSGLANATSGTVRLNGDVIQRPRAEMMYVFQQYTKSIFPWKTVLENVMLAVKYARPRRADMKEFCLHQLDLVGLAKYADFYPYQLSGGMQQRVAIARSLARRPEILLMDEPFSALDAMMRVELQDLMLRLWREFNLTIVFVTHDLDEALYLAQRVIVIGRSPGHVADIVDVPLGYPRDQVHTRSDPQYLALRERLFQLMVEQSRPLEK